MFIHRLLPLALILSINACLPKSSYDLHVQEKLQEKRLINLEIQMLMDKHLLKKLRSRVGN